MNDLQQLARSRRYSSQHAVRIVELEHDQYALFIDGQSFEYMTGTWPKLAPRWPHGPAPSAENHRVPAKPSPTY